MHYVSLVNLDSREKLRPIHFT